MAAVNAGNDMNDLNKQSLASTEMKVEANSLEETEIILSPDNAALEAKREEIRAKINTVSNVVKRNVFETQNYSKTTR